TTVPLEEHRGSLALLCVGGFRLGRLRLGGLSLRLGGLSLRLAGLFGLLRGLDLGHPVSFSSLSPGAAIVSQTFAVPPTPAEKEPVAHEIIMPRLSDSMEEG